MKGKRKRCSAEVKARVALDALRGELTAAQRAAKHGIHQMDERGRWMDDVFIERPWRSLKHGCACRHAFETGSELRAGLSRWIGHHNARRPHPTLAGRTPGEACGASGMGLVKPAA